MMAERIEYTFSGLVQGRENDFPVLARALRDQEPAKSTFVEWEVDGEAWGNFTQIVRFPFGDRGWAQGEVGGTTEDITESWLNDLLVTIESILEHGVPELRPHAGGLPAIGMCGGYRHYLGRDLRDDDLLRLRVLREPFKMTWDREGASPPLHDLIAEFSLEVVPGSAVPA